LGDGANVAFGVLAAGAVSIPSLVGTTLIGQATGITLTQARYIIGHVNLQATGGGEFTVQWEVATGGGFNPVTTTAHTPNLPVDTAHSMLPFAAPAATTGIRALLLPTVGSPGIVGQFVFSDAGVV
jgi:hypothetical protein